MEEEEENEEINTSEKMTQNKINKYFKWERFFYLGNQKCRLHRVTTSDRGSW